MIATTPTLVPALAPFERALAGMRRRRGPAATRGLVPGLVVPADSGGHWQSATGLVAGGPGLDQLLEAAKKRWSASPHAAAALAWRSYTYWLLMPVGVSWAAARRVPLVAPEDVLVEVGGAEQLLRLGLRRLRLAVLPEDPLVAAAGQADVAVHPPLAVTVVDSPAELLDVLRSSVRETHLDPLLAQIRGRVHLGERALLGSLASAAAYAVVRGGDGPPGGLAETARTLLTALGVADLVTIEPGPERPEVRRHTCCLAFTLPEPKICSGCCLPRPV